MWYNGRVTRTKQLKADRYAIARAAGKTQAEAARVAGIVSERASDKSAAQEGCRLEALDSVRSRIAQINEGAITAAQSGPALVRTILAYEALTAGEASSRVRAAELLGKLNGQFVDRSMSITASVSDATLLEVLRQGGASNLADTVANAITALPTAIDPRRDAQ